MFSKAANDPFKEKQQGRDGLNLQLKVSVVINELIASTNIRLERK
jgi:hypothetical protein